MKHIHNNKEIVFDEDAHTYYSRSARYSTVTQNVSRFFPKFNMKRISFEFAVNNNLNQNDVIKMWQTEGKESSEFGKLIHKYIERKLLNKSLMNPSTEKEKKYFINIDIWLADFLKYFNVVGVERVVFSPKYEIAGTIDAIFQHKKTKQFLVIDWKTSKEITTENKWQNCLYDLKNFRASHFNKFSFQLNSYLYILKNEQYYQFKQKPKLAVIHITENEIKNIKIPILSKKIMNVLF